MIKLISVFSLMILSFSALAGNRMISRFNHDIHDEKVFSQQQIKCSSCHNIEQDADGKYKANANLEKSTFQRPLKAICHECHNGEDRLYDPKKGDKAPKSCYTCHDSLEQISAIQPPSHQTQFWKSTHGNKARMDGASCLNCHSNSQCSTCHTQRNDVSLKNHMRNFRFFHSIEARMSPQRCDVCHTKSYCTQCHLGRKAP